MTPMMRLSDIKASYQHEPLSRSICHDLERAYQLGHEFGLDRAITRLQELEVAPVRPLTDGRN